MQQWLIASTASHLVSKLAVKTGKTNMQIPFKYDFITPITP